MTVLARIVRALPLLILSPLLALLSILSIALCDLLWLIVGRRLRQPGAQPRTSAATVVIPNWNGRDLLEKYLPSVIAAVEGNPRNEILVVDNGSTDGSVELLRTRFPRVRTLAISKNLGFGGGSNAGFRAARNDIVVLLNSDMRVDREFLQPLLDGFTDSQVFAVSCQIFFSDPAKVREETGLTQAWWANGGLRVRHRIDEAVNDLYPCFYGGGGSCAFDRRKFLELGGFDENFAPFYLEDTDLGYLAWKRGWKVLFQPKSIVFHEHRGTIGKKFSQPFIDSVLKKNFVLFCWKNIHEWRRLTSHFFHSWMGAFVSLLFGDSPERANLSGLWRASLQLPGALRARWRARSLARVSDTEAFLRPLGAYFRDRFLQLPKAPERVGVLFVSPYPIYPPVHGGGVFMYQAVRELSKHVDLHLVALLDHARERDAHACIDRICASAEYLVRMSGKSKTVGSIEPHAVREFSNPDLEWIIHRQIYTRRIDVLQLEYANLGQYAGRFRQLVCALFEHDVYFQSIARGSRQMRRGLRKLSTNYEYLRALRYELRMLPQVDQVQVCSRENGEYLESFLPALKGRIEDGLRAGIDAADYRFRPHGREPFTMLFLGSFRHIPNAEALDWFVQRVLPCVLQRRPGARLIVIGSDPPPRHSLSNSSDAIELQGFVENVREPLERYAVFICPILSGSGVRVKLLEAFASGIPVVSTRLGAEGLASDDGDVCALADDPDGFAERIGDLFDRPDLAAAMAKRAREHVVAHRNMEVMMRKLEESYRALLTRKRSSTLLPDRA